LNDIQQLEQAIAALEGQRGILGDAVVDAALAPMREKLAALQAQAVPSEQQRKQVTVLFADVSGFTAMSETLDAEEVTEIMNALWARLDAAITAQGGQIDKHIGDAVMALWGVESAREDDPERAIRAALAMQAEIRNFVETQQLASRQMRIGLNTGPVLLGEVGTTHEFTAMGDAVNLASRLEHAAPVGGVLISHATYRQVRGVFDVQAQAPLAVKGKAAPVQTYVVLQAKPRAFRMGTRGVEGIETHMVGRDAELLTLQSAFADALDGIFLQRARRPYPAEYALWHLARPVRLPFRHSRNRQPGRRPGQVPGGYGGCSIARARRPGGTTDRLRLLSQPVGEKLARQL
jgi:class 3 adenylate cyclase